MQIESAARHRVQAASGESGKRQPIFVEKNADISEKLAIEIEKLTGLQELETALQPFQAVHEAVAPMAQEARTALISGAAARFDELNNAIKERVRQVQRDGAMGERGAGVIQAISLASPPLVQAEQQAAAIKTLKGAPAFFAKTLAFLSGTQVIGADLRFWLIRPLLYLTVLICLTLLGLQTIRQCRRHLWRKRVV